MYRFDSGRWLDIWRRAPDIPVRLQARTWSCGAAALVNAGFGLGRKFSERRVRKLAGTTEDSGTDEVGLMNAARMLGLTATPTSSVDAASAWALVRSNVLGGKKCLLCIDNWGHWVTAIGISGDRIVVFDPTNSTRNVQENGCHSLSRRDLLRRWRHKAAEEPFYSIAIGR